MLDNFREWLSDNLRYILLGLVVVLIVVIGFCVVKLVGGSSSSDNTAGSGKTESEISTEISNSTAASTGTTSENSTEKTEETSTPASEGSSENESLVKDDAAVLTLVKKYYTAAAQKDVTTLQAIVNPWNDEVKNSILQNDVIESYNNISTYSKKGPEANSYIVYVYYEGKVVNIDTPAPSLAMLYLTTDASGNLIVSDRNASQEVADYIARVSSNADVQALIADVNTQCENAKNSDPALKEFMDSLTSQDTQSGQPEDASDTAAAGSKMTATAELNIRQEPSTDSAIMGVVTSGSTVTKLEDADDGWCKISYDADSYTIEGYVKSEYLSATGAA